MNKNCENCTHSIKVSEETIFCDLRKIFRWQDDDCQNHAPQATEPAKND